MNEEFEPPKELGEVLSVFEALRRLGVPSENIFVSFDKGEELHVVIKEEDKTGLFRVCCFSYPEHLFSALWVKSVGWWNNPENVEKASEIYQRSKARENAGVIIAALMSNGFTIAIERPVANG